MRDDVTIMEFYGLPGSGKSYLSQLVTLQQKYQGLSIGDTVPRVLSYGRVMRMLLKLPLVFGAVLRGKRTSLARIQGFCSSASISTYLKTKVNLLFLEGAIKRDLQDTELVVLDQGLAQALWSRYFGAKCDAAENPERSLQTAIDYIGATRYIFVKITANLDVIEDRIENRTNKASRLDGSWSRLSREAEVALDVADRAVDNVCEQAADRVHKIVLDNSRSFDKATESSSRFNSLRVVDDQIREMLGALGN